MRVFSKIPLTILFLLCISPIIALAAEDCPALVQSALTATDSACVSIGRNQACYGNVTLDVTPQAGAEVFTFSKPGDLVALAAVQSLTLSSMNEASKEWGIAMMKVQANLPDTLPGQNVTFLMFGDVQIQNVVASNVEAATVSVTAKGAANVRSGPSTTDNSVGKLSGGQTLSADGRNGDASWLHVQLDDGTAGWVFAKLMTVDGDPSTLTEVDAAAPPAAPSSPIQAFYFKSGVGASPCAEAPNGLLIQSPAGAKRVNLRVNGVDLSIGSTIFLRTPNGGDANQMVVSTLAGVVQVAAGGVTQTVIPGAQVSIPLDANGQAAGAPSAPQPYDGQLLTPVISGIIQAHNLLIHLEADSSDLLTQLIAACGLQVLTVDDTTITVSADEVATLTACVDAFLTSQGTQAGGQAGQVAAPGAEIVIEQGAYDFAYTTPGANCPANAAPPDTDLMIITDNGGGSLNVGAAGTKYVVNQSGVNTYQSAGGAAYQITLTANADGTLNFQWSAGQACLAMGTLKYSSE
ncbi:MAG: SH3 domain-containing protein [Chloroflexota bacterium]